MPPQTQTIVQTAENMRDKLTEKATMDSDFRARLISDPKSVTFEEFGVTIPNNVQLHVHESDKYNFHLSLPPSSELDDEQLEMIAAGLSCCI